MGQGPGLYTLDINSKAGEGIFVTYFQVKPDYLLSLIMLNVTYGVFWLQRKGYAKITSLAEYNGTVDKEQWPQGLFSFTICMR